MQDSHVARALPSGCMCGLPASVFGYSRLFGLCPTRKSLVHWPGSGRTMVSGQSQERETEPFVGLLLRHRGRTGLTQRDFAARMGTSERSIQDWEAGAYYPGAQHLKSLIAVLVEAGGFAIGSETVEGRGLWAAVLRESPRMHTPFDELWLAELLAKRAARSDPNLATEPIATVPAEPSAGAGAVAPTFRFAPRGARREDWGEAPDVLGFVGRTEELTSVRDWVLQQRC